MFAHHELLNDRPSAFISVTLSAVLEEAKTEAQKYVDPRHAHTGAGMEVDKMEVAFRQRTPHDKKLVISVRANGEAYVSISTFKPALRLEWRG